MQLNPETKLPITKATPMCQSQKLLWSRDKGHGITRPNRLLKFGICLEYIWALRTGSARCIMTVFFRTVINIGLNTIVTQPNTKGTLEAGYCTQLISMPGWRKQLYSTKCAFHKEKHLAARARRTSGHAAAAGAQTPELNLAWC